MNYVHDILYVPLNIFEKVFIAVTDLACIMETLLREDAGVFLRSVH